MSLRPVDFLRPPAAPRRGMRVLAAGVLALAVAQWFDWQWAAERAQDQQQAEQRAEQVRQEKDAAKAEARRSQAPAVPSAAERRLAHAQAELRRPWMASLRAVESAAVDPVYLLSLSVDPNAGALRLEAEAPSFEHALAFTQMLADGEALPIATLASHEQVADAATGRPSVRFTVLARWGAP